MKSHLLYLRHNPNLSRRSSTCCRCSRCSASSLLVTSVFDVAENLWNVLQDGIHHLLKHHRGRCDAIGQSGVSIEPFVCVDGGERLGLVAKAQLLVGLPQVEFGELLTSSQHGQEILGPWKWVLLNCQSFVYSDFAVTTQEITAILLGADDDRSCSVTVRDLLQDSSDSNLSSWAPTTSWMA